MTKIILEVDTDHPIEKDRGTFYFIPEIESYISKSRLSNLKKKQPIHSDIDIFCDFLDWYGNKEVNE